VRTRFVVLGLAAVVLAVGLAWFEPWRLVTSSTVDEAAPSSTPTQTPEARPPGSATPSATSSATSSVTPAPVADTVLARGRFESAEHDTSGDVVVLALADGRRFLRLEDLATSDGPDLHVWLTDRPSGGGWGSYDDGRHVALGGLKANRGNQNYEIPADARLDGLTSVVVWCDRFDVAFGTAPVDL
jgi:Electron transfer DM13